MKDKFIAIYSNKQQKLQQITLHNSKVLCTEYIGPLNLSFYAGFCIGELKIGIKILHTTQTQKLGPFNMIL